MTDSTNLRIADGVATVLFMWQPAALQMFLDTEHYFKVKFERKDGENPDKWTTFERKGQVVTVRSLLAVNPLGRLDHLKVAS